ncbi:hypothetical protein RJT34_01951 [Clitoria ternatea]|uniref:Uncharacterized protein n=1 Tax=Clitoria ternatea TaxID=43366 RepID=A0AAN9KJV4_CLITE
MKYTALCYVFLLFLLPYVASYRYLKLALQWPTGVCANRKCVKNTHRTDFGIHGLWPQNRIGYPFKCTNSALNLTLINNLIPGLTTSWSSLFFQQDSVFWSHEWSEHGTCSEHVLDQHAYFQLALNMKNFADLPGALTRANIRPSNTTLYNTARFSAAIKGQISINATPELTCANPTVLTEVRLCLIYNGTSFINCPYAGNCLRNPTVRFLQPPT